MIDNPTLLIPIDASAPEQPPQPLVDLLEPLRIVVLGHYPVPDQAAPQQIQEAHEEDVKASMKPIVQRFAAQDADVNSVLVFTRDHVTSTDRVANEHDCTAVLVPGSVGDLSSVLVSLKDEENMFRVLEIVGLLLDETDPTVTLFHAESVEKGSAISELLLRGATDWLTERGLGRDRISWREPTAETQTRDLLALAEHHDFVIMGESEPHLVERVLGELPDRIHARTGRAVLVVRKER